MNDAADLYIATFAARSDVYVRWNGTSWVRSYEPLTADTLVAAFTAHQGVSAYPQSPAGTHLAIVDFDTDDGLERARALRGAMAIHGVFAYISPSRRGAHLWVVLDHTISAATVRRALRGFIAAALLPEDDPKIELRPGHDQVKPDGFGTPIRLPTSYHPKTGIRYPLLDAADQPIGWLLAELVRDIEWTPSSAFVEMAARIPTRYIDLDKSYKPPKLYRPPEDIESVSDLLRTLWGAENAQPGRSIKCPCHDDHVASLSILRDDERVICKSPTCELHNSGHGLGPGQLKRLAQSRTITAAG